MKKLTLVLFVLLSTNVFAQKSYVTVFVSNLQRSSYAYLSGDIPSSMKTEYKSSDFPQAGSYPEYWIGEILNMLAAQGYSVEQMSTGSYHDGNNNQTSSLFLLSKSSNGNGPNAIIKIEDNNSEDVHEVARYNLQGIPVTETEKGIQIIVYSNFTTKTIIKQ